MKYLSLFFFAFFFLVLVQPANAQQSVSPDSLTAREILLIKQVTGCTDSQAVQVRQESLRYQQDVTSLRKQQRGMDSTAYKQSMKKYLRSYRQGVKAVLTKNQFKTYKAYLAERRSAFRKRSQSKKVKITETEDDL